ncbi:MAG TPA: NAD(P)H:quinone oxidoreductase [Salegentibacter sp.]|nr:NAD(P)H:quinone oxidoreductase [Salegentibacter sp.]
MSKVNLAVIYYSSTGTNHQLAKWAEEAGNSSGAGEVRLRKIKETAPKEAIAQNKAWEKHVEAARDVTEASLDDLEWADAIIFSIPTRYGNMPSQVQQFIDTTGGLWSQGRLANKIVSGMTSASNPHGGQETTLMSLYKTMIHWGAIIVAPGYTDKILFESGGNPYGLSVTAGKDELDDKIKKSVSHQVKRMVETAGKLKS